MVASHLYGLVVKRKCTYLVYNIVTFLVFQTTSSKVRWDYYYRILVFLLTYLIMDYDGTKFSFCFVWCPCVAINVSVQHNDGFLPNIILLTQCYYHWGTRLNTMKRFCLCNL